MKIIKKSAKTMQPFKGEGADGVAMVNLIGDDEGAPNFVMRLFRIAPEGHTPFHHHENEHVVYILKGSGLVHTPAGDCFFEAGDGVFVAPNEEHQFKNTGAEELMFTCTIPLPAKMNVVKNTKSCCGG